MTEGSSANDAEGQANLSRIESDGLRNSSWSWCPTQTLHTADLAFLASLNRYSSTPVGRTAATRSSCHWPYVLLVPFMRQDSRPLSARPSTAADAALGLRKA